MTDTTKEKKDAKQEKKDEAAGKKLFAELGASKFAGKYVIFDDASGSLSLAGVEETRENAEHAAHRLASKRGAGADSTPEGLYIVEVPEPEAVSGGPTNPAFSGESNEAEKPGDIAFRAERQKVADKKHD